MRIIIVIWHQLLVNKPVIVTASTAAVITDFTFNFRIHFSFLDSFGHFLSLDLLILKVIIR